MANQLIKRVSVGGYVKADTTGTGTWEVGKIEKFDDKFVWFESALDGQEVRISRQEAYKATAEEFKAEAAKRVPTSKEMLQNMTEVLPPKTANQSARVGSYSGKAIDSELDADEEDRLEQLAEEAGEAAKSIIKAEYKERYVKAKAASGKSSRHSGDPIAVALEGKSLEECFEYVAEAMGESPEDYAARWAHLNVGQQRMCVGNRLRTFLKKQSASEEMAASQGE